VLEPVGDYWPRLMIVWIKTQDSAYRSAPPNFIMNTKVEFDPEAFGNFRAGENSSYLKNVVLVKMAAKIVKVLVGYRIAFMCRYGLAF
jgi:hypothetical protein